MNDERCKRALIVIMLCEVFSSGVCLHALRFDVFACWFAPMRSILASTQTYFVACSFPLKHVLSASFSFFHLKVSFQSTILAPYDITKNLNQWIRSPNIDPTTAIDRMTDDPANRAPIGYAYQRRNRAAVNVSKLMRDHEI